MEEEYDLVVVGGGVYGLPIIKTYLQVNPTANVLLLDAGHSVGGTWSAERIYPSLYSNNQLGTLEYADFPMSPETYGVKPGSHIPGEIIHRYLCDYVDHYGFRDRIRLQVKVESVELQDDGSWIVRYNTQNSGQIKKEVQLVARKLVLATGTSSEPYVPEIEGSDNFNGLLFHSVELAKHAAEMTAAKNVVVYGGSKSAADAVYLSASQGRHVDWIIRASGRGPAWLSHALVSPAKLVFERLTTTRCLSFVTPSFELDAYPTIRRFLHNTWIGQILLNGFFAIINADIISQCKYNEHPETKKLKPRSSIYWWGSTVGLLNHPTDLFSLIRQGLVKVHVADINSLSPYTVHLSDGKDISADIFVYATGYKQTQTIKFLPEKLTSKIGMFTASLNDGRVKAADAEIMSRFPELKDQPTAGPNGILEREQTSYKLYRNIVPPHFLTSRNFAYSGMAVTLRGFLAAQIEALWITAFLDGRLSTPLPSEAEAEWQALLQMRFWRWRAPNGLGPKSADMVFEILPFFDTLLRDLGLTTARKKGLMKELFEYYGVNDYRELVAEWLQKEKETKAIRESADGKT